MRTKQPTGKRTENQYEKPTGKRTEDRYGKPTGKRTETRYEKPTGKHTEYAHEKPTGKRTEDRYGKPTGKHTEYAHEKSNKKWIEDQGANSQKETAQCPYARKCGGCDYQGVDYAIQLKQKYQFVKECMKPYCKTEKIIGMDNPLHYRHKVHATFDCSDRGKIISGIYRERTHEVVDITECMIEDTEADQVIQDVKGMLRSFRIKTYDEDTGYGLLRHVMIRKAYNSGEMMLILVTGSPIFPSKNNFVKAIRKLHPSISTVVLNVNDKKTSMVLGTRNITLFGKGYIEDRLCGLTFRISPNSFYQVNPAQTELLYEKVVSLAGLTSKERVIDAYCGTGTIGMIVAGVAREVIGVERNKDAVRDAVINASVNKIPNIRFYNEDAGKFMTEMAEAGEKADIVIMDPPRAGSTEEFLASLIRLAPRKIVYVSCNPLTLAEDAKRLTKNGYQAVNCVPFDCFPYTRHVETVCLLSKKCPV